jgi:hypothetical protein
MDGERCSGQVDRRRERRRAARSRRAEIAAGVGSISLRAGASDRFSVVDGRRRSLASYPRRCATDAFLVDGNVGRCYHDPKIAGRESSRLAHADQPKMVWRTPMATKKKAAKKATKTTAKKKATKKKK